MLGLKALAIEGDQLISPQFRFTWEPGVNRARCAYKHIPASASDCQCGFHATWHREDALIYGRWWRHIGDAFCLAVIEPFGVTAVHERGFRAEMARVRYLIQPSPWERLENWLSTLTRSRLTLPQAVIERYQIEVIGSFRAAILVGDGHEFRWVPRV